MVEVWIADAMPLMDEIIYKKYYENLPDWRKEKADRIRRSENKALSVAAWALWSYIKKEKNLPEDTIFNLSHSGHMVMCAFSDIPGTKVGCDLEEKGTFGEGVARRFFCESEYQYIMEASSEAEKRERFFRYWVLKESFMKATREGMALDMRTYEIGWDEREVPYLMNKPEKFAETYYYKEYFHPGVNACMAVCTTDEEIDKNLHILTL